MNIDLSNFIQKPCVIAGDDCLLITPNDIMTEWTKDNLNYRSVIVRASDWKPISCGFPKFFNNTEKPALYPNPEEFHDWEINEKLDGSLICISKYKGQLIVRTRGVVDAFIHDSGPELKQLIEDNNLISNNLWVDSEEYTLLFEHLSVINPIIIKHKQPKLVLIGAIINKNYYILPSQLLDIIAVEIGVGRPINYSFKNLSEIVNNCKELKGMEGYVLSYNGSQNRIKLKGDNYLMLHRAKSQISSFDKIVDLFFALGKPEPYQAFYDAVEKHLDHELAEIASENLLEVTVLYQEVTETLKEISDFVLTLDGLSRKDAALKIKDKFESRGLCSFAFNLLNKKEILDKDKIKLLLQFKENNDEADADEYNYKREVEAEYYKPYLNERTDSSD